jgi:hypothetical protein
MQPDPIVEEMRRWRREYAEQFDFDLRAIAADLQKCEQRHLDRLVFFSPKPGRKKKTVQASRLSSPTSAGWRHSPA